MKKIVSVQPASTSIDIALLVARIGIGVLMLTHGLPKFATLLSGDPIQFASVFGLSPALSLSLAVFAEVFCSIFLIVGFVTRLSVLPLITTMLVASLSILQTLPFEKKELLVLYLLVYVILFFAGSGRFSLDYIWQERASKNNYTVGDMAKA